MAESTELTADDIAMVNTVCAFVSGHASTSFWDKPTSFALGVLSDFFLSNPLATKEEVMATIGWSSKSYDYLDENLAPLNETITMFGSLTSEIPHPETTHAIIPIFVVFTLVSTIVMSLRLWSRLSIVGRIQSFDYVAIVAYLLILAWGILAVGEKVGSGKYGSFCDRSFNQIVDSVKFYGLGMMTYPIVVLSVKISLLMFYHQLSNWWPLRWAVYVTGFISIGNALAACFAWMFQGNYVNIWDYAVSPDLGEPRFVLLDMVLATGSINIITDVLIWLIPMPLVWKLQLYPRERLIAVFTFGLGLIACAASIVRLYMVNQYIYFGDGNESGNAITPINAWGLVELNLALICSSAPALRALVVKYKPKLLSYGSSHGAAGSKENSINSGSLNGEKSGVTTNSRVLASPEP